MKTLNTQSSIQKSHEKHWRPPQEQLLNFRWGSEDSHSDGCQKNRKEGFKHISFTSYISEANCKQRWKPKKNLKTPIRKQISPTMMMTAAWRQMKKTSHTAYIHFSSSTSTTKPRVCGLFFRSTHVFIQQDKWSRKRVINIQTLNANYILSKRKCSLEKGD